MEAKVRKAHNSMWACRRACGGVWDPGWFIGSMSLSLGRPSPLHP